MSRLTRFTRERLVVCGVAVVLACLASAPAHAPASADQTTIFDPGTAILSASPDARARQLVEISEVGAETVRVVVPWRSVAPAPGAPNRPHGFDAADPADYPNGAFAPIDQLVRGARVLGMNVLLNPSAPIPDWAGTTGQSTVDDPIPSEYQAFVEALGHRYSGSYRDSTHFPGCPLLLCPPAGDRSPIGRISHWAIWNEPNIGIFLGPQFRDGRPYSPLLYRRLFLAGRDGLADSGHRADSVLIGETATSGGRTGIDPLDFARGVFCMDRRFGPAHPCEPLAAAGFAHHPYGYSTPPQFRSPNRGLIDLANLGRLDRLLARAHQVGATTTLLPVYITEFGVLSRPHPAGFSPVRQATDMAAAEFLAWRDPSVAAFGQYLLRDDPPQNEIIFTTGLRYSDDSAKPLRRAFPLTMLVRRVGGGGVSIWGHVRPRGGGRAYVEVWTRNAAAAGSLPRVVRTNRHGYFRLGSRFRPGRRWQARAVLPDGRRLVGPYLPALRFPLPVLASPRPR